MPKNRLRFHPTLLHRAREMRHEPTLAEQTLWQVLRNRNLNDFKFRRQHPLGWFIADFYCPEIKLVIEVDGEVHATRQEYDAARSKWLQEHGYTVIRFQNQQVLEELAAVLDEIFRVCQELKANGH